MARIAVIYLLWACGCTYQPLSLQFEPELNPDGAGDELDVQGDSKRLVDGKRDHGDQLRGDIETESIPDGEPGPGDWNREDGNGYGDGYGDDYGAGDGYPKEGGPPGDSSAGDPTAGDWSPTDGDPAHGDGTYGDGWSFLGDWLFWGDWDLSHCTNDGVCDCTEAAPMSPCEDCNRACILQPFGDIVYETCGNGSCGPCETKDNCPSDCMNPAPC